MSATSLMTIGVSAMKASYAALQTTGNNIANANVPGYSREQAQFATSGGQFTGAGFFGNGVDVTTVTRAHDDYLTREAVLANSQAAGDQSKSDQLKNLENVFPTGAQGLGAISGTFLNSMVDLASQPQDSSTRQVVLANAQSVSSAFAAAGGQLDNLQTGITDDLKTGVASVNKLTQQIASVNDQISRVSGSGQPPNNLLDQRDQLISQLSSLVQVSTLPSSDGSLGVFMANGQRLVLGNQVTALAVVPDAYDISRQAIAVVDGSVTRALPQQFVGTGSLGGLLSFQNNDLVAARTQLGQMAAALSGSVNQQQALGLDLRNPPGGGAPMFSVGPPVALPAQTNAKDAAGNFVSSVSMSVTDPTQLQASEYDLRADPANAGQYLLTRNSDGLMRSIASGATVDGMTLNVGPPAPAAGDSFLLQPVTRAANNMQTVLNDPNGIAAASPLQATAGVSNTGTATIGSLTVTSAAANPQNTATITFTDSSGDYTWSLNDRTTNALVGSGTGTWQAGTAISLNGFALQLSGVPAGGDQFSVAQTAQPASNNGNALALAALGTQTVVNGQTITDAYSSAIANIGVRVQSAKTAATISAGVVSSAQAARSSQAGVNLDEEAARLIQYQQSYQAAAKVLQIAQTLFTTLITTALAA